MQTQLDGGNIPAFDEHMAQAVLGNQIGLEGFEPLPASLDKLPVSTTAGASKQEQTARNGQEEPSFKVLPDMFSALNSYAALSILVTNGGATDTGSASHSPAVIAGHMVQEAMIGATSPPSAAAAPPRMGEGLSPRDAFLSLLGLHSGSAQTREGGTNLTQIDTWQALKCMSHECGMRSRAVVFLYACSTENWHQARCIVQLLIKQRTHNEVHSPIMQKATHCTRSSRSHH